MPTNATYRNWTAIVESDSDPWVPDAAYSIREELRLTLEVAQEHDEAKALIEFWLLGRRGPDYRLVSIHPVEAES